MLGAVGLGIGSLFQTYPVVHTVLKFLGAAYLIWLAWKIATSQAADMPRSLPRSLPVNNNSGARPLTFLQAAAFQWVNPKAWVMAISAVSTYTTVSGNLWLEVTVITAMFALVCYPCVSFWTMVGVGVAKVLRSGKTMRIFNMVMALLLMVSIAPIFLM